MENLGERIKSIRCSYELSQDRFGKRLGISGKTISAYENNKITPPLKTLKGISKIYKVNLYELPNNKRCEIDQKINEALEIISEIKAVIYQGLSF